jgi:plasmid stabilization system protein ParE
VTHFVLSGRAQRDVAAIISHLHLHVSPEAADEFEHQLFAALHDLVRLSGPGHRRPDLTLRDVLFEFVLPYFIIFQKKRGAIHVVRVLHSARNISKLI